MNNNYLIFGPPCAGKGTQAVNITKLKNIIHISTGAIFRENIKKKTQLGIKALEFINTGALVPDEITNEMVSNRLNQPDTNNGFLLDGYPRNVKQCTELDKILAKINSELTAIIVIDIPTEEIKTRLQKRATLEGRSDDADPTIIENRIKNYLSESKPCIDYYQSSGKVIKIVGIGSIKEIEERIKKSITY